MKKKKAQILLCIMLCLSLLSADVLPLFADYQAQASLPTQPVGLIESKNINGEYVVSVFTTGHWKETGRLGYDIFLTEKSLDLSGYLTDKSSAIVRIAQESGEAAHLDSVFMGGKAPQSINSNDGELLGKLSEKDLDLITVDSKGIELLFPANRENDTLSITGRIEGEKITKEPFKFPNENTYKEVDKDSQFYSYTLNSTKRALTVDGSLEEILNLEPLFKDFCTPGTGHPEGYTYGWVMNDDEYLYAVVDFTPDNTMDGEKDYSKLYVKTASGVKEFKVSVPETTWGQTAFIYTDKVEYQHKVYEFKIPLSEISETENDLSLAFSAYGTAAPPIEIDGYYAEGQNRLQPAVAYDPILDRYLLVYQNTGYDYADNGIMGQFITSEADTDGDLFPIGVRYEGDPYMLKRTPEVAYGDGIFLATWIEDDFYNYKVMGRFIAADGSFLTDTFAIDNENSCIRDSNLSIEYGDDGNFLVVWSDDDDIIGRIISLDKNTEPHTEVVSEEIQISLNDHFYRSPSVAYSEESGKFLVAWDVRESSSNDFDIYGRIVKQDGIPETDEIAICTEINDQSSPSVTYNTLTKSFFLIWKDERSDIDGCCIYGKYLDSNGNPLVGIEEKIVDASGGNYEHPTIEYSSLRNEYLPIWAENYYYRQESPAAHGCGQQLNEDLTEAGARLVFGEGIYNSNYTKLDLTSSTRKGKYLVVYPCIYMDMNYDYQLEYLKWELIGEDIPENHGIIQFESASNQVGEGDVSARIKVIRTGGSDGQIKVNYTTRDYDYNNSATPDVDYKVTQGIMILEDKQTYNTFDIPMYEDTTVEDNEHIGLVLSEPTGGAELGSLSIADLNIIDNDIPDLSYISFYNPPYTVAENVYEKSGINYAEINVFFSGFDYFENESNFIADRSVFAAVYYKADNGTATDTQDYSSVEGKLEFNMEDYDKAAGGYLKSFTIPIIDDSNDEPDETIQLTLSQTIEGPVIKAPNPTTLTILDNDTSPPVIKDDSKKESKKVSQKEPQATPPVEQLPNDALVGRMPGYVAISIPTNINEVKKEIILSYNKTTLNNNPGHDPRIYYWRPEVKKWVALSTYPDGDGTVKAINDGGYKGWFVVFGVVQPHFSDVSTSWAEQLINRMNGLGLIEGYQVKGSDLRVAKPEQKVTRAEFTMFITRIMNMNPDNILLPDLSDRDVESILKKGYTDESEITPWVRAAVAKAIKAGLVPFESSSFKPLEPITRIEAAVMVSRSLKKFKDFKTLGLTNFKDYSDIPDWAINEIVEGSIEGYTDKTLKPNKDIARAESLAMLLRLFIKGLGW